MNMINWVEYGNYVNCQNSCHLASRSVIFAAAVHDSSIDLARSQMVSGKRAYLTPSYIPPVAQSDSGYRER